MTHTAQVRASLAAIPRNRWRYKLAKLVVALGLGALLYFVALPQKWSVFVILGIAAAIGFCISEDVMKAIVKFLVAAVRDLAGALPTKSIAAAPSAAPTTALRSPDVLPSGKAYGNDQPPG